jgi:hypothetical protein
LHPAKMLRICVEQHSKTKAAASIAINNPFQRICFGTTYQHQIFSGTQQSSERERERESNNMRVADHGTYLGEILKSCEREVCACSKDSERYLLLLLLARFLYGGGSPGLQALKVLFGDSSGSVR